jgi:hypothetical protein
MLRLLADAGTSLARSLGLYLLVFVGLPLLIAAISLAWRLRRRLPDVDGDPQAVLEHPGRFVESVGARRFVRELLAPLPLIAVAVSFVAPALAIQVLVGDSPLQQDEGTVSWITRNLWWIAGLFGVLLIGRWAAADIASRRARRYANSRLQAALRQCWRRERSLIASWGRQHGLSPIERLGFTQGLDTTPILLEGTRCDYANALRGPLEGSTATFFHLTQLGDFAGRPPPGENEASEPAFRWLTCVHVKRRPRDLVMTLRPRRPHAPPCGLNEVPLEAVGEAWRSSSGDAALDVASPADEEGPRVEVLERLVAAGQLPPRALELRREWDAAAPEERKRLRREISREILGWRAGDRAAALELGRALSDRGWRSIRLESVAFNERYELRTKDRDDLEVVGIFDPAFIVEVTEQLRTDVFVEIHDANLLVAIPGRVLDEEILDELLVTADHLGRHVDESPLPA